MPSAVTLPDEQSFSNQQLILKACFFRAKKNSGEIRRKDEEARAVIFDEFIPRLKQERLLRISSSIHLDACFLTVFAQRYIDGLLACDLGCRHSVAKTHEFQSSKSSAAGSGCSSSFVIFEDVADRALICKKVHVASLRLSLTNDFCTPENLQHSKEQGQCHPGSGLAHKVLKMCGESLERAM